MSARVAVITGGAGELAQAVARQLTGANYLVHAPGHSELDVANPISIQEYFAHKGGVDLLINNAGSIADSTVRKMTESQWDEILQVNLRGAFLCAQAVSLAMVRQRSGHIIHVGSFSARWGNFGQANYAAAKAGLIGLTHSTARELGRRNVRVNCVLPGFLETKFTASLPDEVRQRIRQMHELPECNTVEDSARFIAFLDTMSAVSGQVFQLDSRVSPWT